MLSDLCVQDSQSGADDGSNPPGGAPSLDCSKRYENRELGNSRQVMTGDVESGVTPTVFERETETRMISANLSGPDGDGRDRNSGLNRCCRDRFFTRTHGWGD